MKPLFLASVALCVLFTPALLRAADPAPAKKQTVTVQMWYSHKTMADTFCPNDGEGNRMPVSGSGDDLDSAIADAYENLIAVCRDYSTDDWDLMISGDGLIPPESAARKSSPPPSEHRTLGSAWDATAVYWCDSEGSTVGASGSVTGKANAAAAISGAIADLHANNSSDIQCGEEEPYDPIVKITELNENPELEGWIVEITYEFGNGQTFTRVGRGATLSQADCAAWNAIVELASENGGIVKGFSRARGPGVPAPKPDVK